MALASGSFLNLLSPLQQLLQEINFQRAKEMRQMLKDDSGFVVLTGTTYWTDLFVRHFLFQSEPIHNIDSDDLLFFVRKKYIKGSSRHTPKYETEVDVHRKDSRKLPIGDPDVDWEETVYLNMVIHQFDYTLTLAICTRTSPKELQVLKRHSQRVYASPSRRKMDTKGESEDMTYPYICFMVDNFDEVFSDILVRDGEMVCVELVASDKDGTVQGVIFLGSIRYDALKKVYDARQSSLSSKVAQRMTFGLFNSEAGSQTRCEFVRMKGPQGKGHAEMAVTKPKGSGIETPTSEPGFCATDIWDELNDDTDDLYNYKFQRRLSDPSANLNNFKRYGWRTKFGPDSTSGTKARSENEGLDSLACELTEIEAGNLRDDRPASSASEMKLNATTSICCNCFNSKNKKRIEPTSEQMSDIYCRTCDEANSPACLTNISSLKAQPNHTIFLNVENELFAPEDGNEKTRKLALRKKKDKSMSIEHSASIYSSEGSRVNKDVLNGKNNNENTQEYELAHDATTFDLDVQATDIKIGILSEKDSRLMVSVNEKEELPAEQTKNYDLKTTIKVDGRVPLEADCANPSNPLETTDSAAQNSCSAYFCSHSNRRDIYGMRQIKQLNIDIFDEFNGNKSSRKITHIGQGKKNEQVATLPRAKKGSFHEKFYSKSKRMVPKRRTPDGTSIYYWCDLPKRTLKELDDGAYNPLWATRGFTQTFHFWKENRRQQSTPLNAFLTYVTLPWWSIAKDLLDHREAPILTF